MIRAMTSVTFITLSGSALGFFIQVLLARELGIGLDIDAYFFSLSMPTFLAGLMATLLSYQVTPQLVGSSIAGSTAQRMVVPTACVSGAVALLFCVVGPVVQIALLPTVWGETYDQMQSFDGLERLIFWSWLVGAGQVFQAYGAAWLNASQQHVRAALMALFPYIFTIIFLIIPSDPDVFDAIRGFVTGVLVACALALVLMVGALRRSFAAGPMWGALKKLFTGAPLTFFATISFSAFAVVDSYFAPQAGPGTLSSLGYAQRIVIALSSLVVAGPSAVLVPRFKLFLQNQDYSGLSRLFWVAICAVIVLGGVISTGLWIWAQDITSLLFARGAFGADETDRVAGALRNVGLSLPAMLAAVIAMRALFCFERYILAAAVMGLLWAVIYASFSAIYVEQGARGLGFAFALTWTLYGCCIFAMTAYLIFMARRRTPQFDEL